MPSRRPAGTSSRWSTAAVRTRALKQLDEAAERSEKFAAAPPRQGRRARRREGMAAALRELEAISDLAGPRRQLRLAGFFGRHASPEVGALMQQVRERSAAIQTTLLFFDLEWNEVPDEQAEELIASDELSSPAITCGWSVATARISSPSRRSGSSPRRRSPGRGRRAPVHRADVGDHGRPARHRGAAAAHGGAEPASGAGSLAPRGGRRSLSPRRYSPACAPGRSSTTTCFRTRRRRTGCARSTAGSPRATSTTRPPTSRWEALIEAVSSRTRSRGAGTGSRPACWGIDRLADYDLIAPLG